MRLPTLSQYNNTVNNFAKQFNEVSRLQVQISTGKKIQTASENPLLANQIQGVEDIISYLNSFQMNGSLASNRTDLLSERTQESISLLDRVKELILSAQNDTYNATDLASIATELQGKLDGMMNVANTQDSEGNYIFSGMNVGTPAYVKKGTQYIYQGSQDATFIPIGNRTNVIYNESGARVFGSIKTGNGAYIATTDPVNNTGTGVIQMAGVSNALNNTPDEYQIYMVTNSQGQLAYQLVSTSSGQLIPLPPAASPQDAPSYIPGSSITFNGMSVQISGQPNAGDRFTIKPSTTDNVFNIMQNILNTLSLPVGTEKEKADFHQALSDQASTFNQVASHFRTYLTEVGSRGNIIDDYQDMSKTNLMDAHILSGKLGDADLGEVISDLTQRMTALEITQQSYLKIQDMYSNFLSMR